MSEKEGKQLIIDKQNETLEIDVDPPLHSDLSNQIKKRLTYDQDMDQEESHNGSKNGLTNKQHQKFLKPPKEKLIDHNFKTPSPKVNEAFH